VTGDLAREPAEEPGVSASAGEAPRSGAADDQAIPLNVAAAGPRGAQPGREPERIAAMFDRIVPRYDLMNRLMTMGLDRRWRTSAAVAAAPPRRARVLDVCCGTGDLALALQRRCPDATVTGLDFSEAMLRAARAKAARRAAAVDFVRGDVLALPFPDATFGAVTVGWGVRNVADLDRAFQEMARVARPGARVVCLEATTPRSRAARRFHAVWFERVVPAMGALVAGDAEAYAYLPASVRSFPDADGLAALMRAAGLERVRYRRLGLGAMALHVGEVSS
jgi:demethylmenaquinone methyltransferase/2-methoxy-6-polyprenyl-1,4-benzoquinol methylase